MNTKEPTFEEGPFFFINIATGTNQPHKSWVVWATDAPTAAGVFGTKTGYSTVHIYPELIGSLTDVKRDYKLSSAQISDLHKDGYLKL